MARNTAGLRRGGPGRPKGLPNKATREMKEWARELFESPEWRASAALRIIEGKAPHLEAHVLQVLMPKTDKTDVTSNGKTLAQFLAEIAK